MTKFPFITKAAFACALITGATTLSAQTLSFNIKGTINPGTCKLSVSDIDMGSFSFDEFNAVGHQTRWQPFTVANAGCPAYIKTVVMTFKGAADTNNAQLFATSGAAAGVGIEIQSRGGTVAAPGSALNWNAAIPFDHRARFVQTRAAVTPGVGSAAITIEVAYL
jgi:major type 1 subunit fimbrin (pilin)